MVAQRLSEGAPSGAFDLLHLQAIHRQLFQDVYTWAGELRQLNMNKGGLPFMPHDRLEMGMGDVYRRRVAQGRLGGRDRAAFATGAAEIIGDINHLHPFRDGNGRTQLEYLRLLADQAGHRCDARRLEPQRWVAASIAASERGDYTDKGTAIYAALHDAVKPR